MACMSSPSLRVQSRAWECHISYLHALIKTLIKEYISGTIAAAPKKTLRGAAASFFARRGGGGGGDRRLASLPFFARTAASAADMCSILWKWSISEMTIMIDNGRTQLCTYKYSGLSNFEKWVSLKIGGNSKAVANETMCMQLSSPNKIVSRILVWAAIKKPESVEC